MSTVVFGAVGTSAVYTPLWLAIQRGLFTRYGVRVKLVSLSSRSAMPALMSGEVDIVGDSEAMVQFDPSGRTLAYIGALANRSYFQIYAVPSVHSIKALKGKVVTASSPSSTTAYVMDIVLRHAGLSPNSDVHWDYTGAPPEQLAALQKGLVDAAALPAPTTFFAQKAGLRLIEDTRSHDIPAAALTLVARRSWVSSQQATVEAFFKGLIEGIREAKGNVSVADHVIGQYTHISDPQEITATYQTFASIWPDVPFISQSAVAEAIHDVTSPAAKQHSSADYIDNAPLNALVRTGFIKKGAS